MNASLCFPFEPPSSPRRLRPTLQALPPALPLTLPTTIMPMIWRLMNKPLQRKWRKRESLEKSRYKSYTHSVRDLYNCSSVIDSYSVQYCCLDPLDKPSRWAVCSIGASLNTFIKAVVLESLNDNYEFAGFFHALNHFQSLICEDDNLLYLWGRSCQVVLRKSVYPWVTSTTRSSTGVSTNQLRDSSYFLSGMFIVRMMQSTSVFSLCFSAYMPKYFILGVLRSWHWAAKFAPRQLAGLRSYMISPMRIQTILRQACSPMTYCSTYVIILVFVYLFSPSRYSTLFSQPKAPLSKFLQRLHRWP